MKNRKVAVAVAFAADVDADAVPEIGFISPKRHQDQGVLFRFALSLDSIQPASKSASQPARESWNEDSVLHALCCFYPDLFSSYHSVQYPVRSLLSQFQVLHSEFFISLPSMVLESGSSAWVWRSGISLMG